MSYPEPEDAVDLFAHHTSEKCFCFNFILCSQEKEKLRYNVTLILLLEIMRSHGEVAGIHFS